MSRARSVLDQYSLIADSLLRLHPASGGLARVLVRAAEQVSRNPANLKPELSMEVATTTLYLEATFEDFDPNDPLLADRTQMLADRLDKVLAGEPAQPLEHWMEQLYRRVSDRQTMGSVVGELKVSLGEAEKSLDQFFRSPREKAGLHVAVSQLVQMRGVLSVLGLDQAVQTVTRMRSSVEQILDTEVDEVQAREAGTFLQLGNNLSALSFLVDMLNYQPALAKKLFVFDEVSGELTPLMGRVATERPAAAKVASKALGESVQRVVEDAQRDVNLAELSEQLGTLADQASLAEQEGVAKAAREAAQAVVGTDAEAGAQALVGLAQTRSNEAPVVAPAPADDSLDEEDDLRDIFLEEGREVVGNGLVALDALNLEPGNLEQLTTLRRAFHTLKGSSRMVGLNEFGEAAWAMEQVLNGVLAEQRPAEAPMLALSREAMEAFGRWVEDIASQQDAHWQAQAFRNSGQAWRDEHRYLPLAPVAETVESDEVVEEAFDIELGADAEAETPVTITVETPDAVAPLHEVPIEFAETSPLDLPFDDLPPSDATVSSRAPLLSNIDFAELEDISQAPHATEPVSPASSDVPELEEVEADDGPPSIFDEISLDTEAELPQARDLQDSVPGPLFHPDRPDSVLVVPPEAAAHAQPESTEPQEWSPEIEAVAEAVPAVEEAEAPAAETDAEPEVVAPLAQEPEAEAEPSGAEGDMPDEQTRVIGPLRIGIRLYNVYLNEADEWSRRLCTVLSEWALEHHVPLPDQAEALAHSLAGSSATVGFQPLSEIARALEHALEFVGSHQRAGQAANADQAQLFEAAAEDIRRLLHQFAAGFYKEPSADLLARLIDQLHQAPVSLVSDEIADAEDLSEAIEVAESDPSLDIELNTQWGTEAEGETESEPDTEAEAEPETVLSPLETVEELRGPAQDIDDDIDALDTIDADLFPIFAEEAQELLPQLGGALRQWIARPDNGSARAEVLRNLHTLKGSARLAGALRLGEMAHRMETSVERLGSDALQAADLDPLQVAYDALSARFELLRNTDPSSARCVADCA